jgi:hypothetical protein
MKPDVAYCEWPETRRQLSVSGSVLKRIERVTGVPTISITYDGIGGSKNEVVVPYLKYPRAALSEGRMLNLNALFSPIRLYAFLKSFFADLMYLPKFRSFFLFSA